MLSEQMRSRAKSWKSCFGHRMACVLAALLFTLLALGPLFPLAAAESPTSASPPQAGEYDPTPPPLPSVPPPPPPSPPQPIPAGTVIQSWQPEIPVDLDEKFPVEMLETKGGVNYHTAYGDFAFLRDSPTFLRMNSSGSLAATTEFTIRYNGTLLPPRNGTIDRVTADAITTHSSLHLGGTFLGNLSVTYAFDPEFDKVTIYFDPRSGVCPGLVQIAWLSFTPYQYIEQLSADKTETNFSSLGPLKQIPVENHTIDIKAGRGASPEIRFDFSDAAGDWHSAHAGTFSFDGHTGNAVLILFSAGRLIIDPKQVVSSVSAASIAYGTQRKLLFDGERY